MARPPSKRTRRVEFWTTESQYEAIATLDGIGTLNRADHLRRAAEMYLEFIARNTSAPPRQQLNGQHQAVAEHA